MAEPVDIIYDGHCTFCTRALDMLRRIDTARVMRVYNSHDAETRRARFPMLEGADAANAMFAVAGGRVYRGYFAFKRLLRGIPLAWPLLLLFYLPGSGLIGPRVYAWVARNRRSFGCEPPS